MCLSFLSSQNAAAICLETQTSEPVPRLKGSNKVMVDSRNQLLLPTQHSCVCRSLPNSNGFDVFGP